MRNSIRSALRYSPTIHSIRLLLVTTLFVLHGPAEAARSQTPLSKGGTALYEEAVGHVHVGDYDVAVIHLKNVLQENPEHIPARILLGEAYLRQGRGSAAEKEFRNALWRGADEKHIVVPLGNALLMQRKYEEILRDLPVGRPGISDGFEIFTLRGRANYELNRLEDAERDFERAANLAPREVNPLLGRALVAHARGRWDEALGFLSQVVDIEPDNAEAWFQRAEVLRSTGEYADAQKAYNRALASRPKHMRARIGRASLALFLGQLEIARDDAMFVHEQAPQNVTASFLLWQTLLRLGDIAGAEEAFRNAADRIASLTDEALATEPSLLRIAALIAVAKQNYERANRLFDRLRILSPHDTSVRLLQAEVQLRLGDSANAARTLALLSKHQPENPQIFALLGEAYMAQRQYREASAALERAVELTPDNEAVRAQLALSRIGYGETDNAIAELKQLVDLQAASTSTGILLTTLQLKRGEIKEALATVSRLQDIHPDNPVIANLQGTVLLAIPDRKQAYAAFEKAIAMDASFIPALFNLAQMSIDAGDPARAERHFQEILAIDPRASPAMTGLANIALSRGDENQAIKVLEKAISATPEDTKPFVRLVEVHLRAGRADEAARAAELLSQKHFGSAEAYEMVARARMAQGRHDDAITNYRRAKDAAGFNGETLLRIARDQVKLQDYTGARATLVKAANSERTNDALAALVRLDLKSGATEAAAIRADEVLARNPAMALGHVLRAEVHMANKEYEKAIDAYGRAVDAEPGSEQIIGLASAHYAAGQPEAGLQKLVGWLAKHPDNLYVEREYALRLVGLGRLSEAQPRLERLAKLVPDDPLTLTILARCYQLSKDPRARSTAAAAYELRPEWANAAETLGWILVTEGELRQGLELLREAFAREKNPLTRYHIAVALEQLGRTDEARVELEALLKMGEVLPWLTEVKALLSNIDRASD